jgi:hypothetical protein
VPTTPEAIAYDTFLTLTIKNYSKTLEKNFLLYRPSVNLLFDDYGHPDTRGGRIWQGIVEYGTSPTVKFFAGADTFAQEPAQTAQPIQYQWRYLGGTVSMTKTEMLENSGPVALADIAETRINQVMRTMNLVLGNEIFSDGTNYNGQTIIGLGAGLATTTGTTLGGLSQTSFPFWQNSYRTSCGSFSQYGVAGTNGDYFVQMYNNLTDGAFDKPSAIISDQTCWEFYHRQVVQTSGYNSGAYGGTVRYSAGDGQKSADLSVDTLRYRGMPWHWDRQCPTGYVYFLNNKYVHFKVDPRFKFEWTDPLTYPNQLAYTRIVGTRMCLVYTSRMYLGVMTGWTA